MCVLRELLYTTDSLRRYLIVDGYQPEGLASSAGSDRDMLVGASIGGYTQLGYAGYRGPPQKNDDAALVPADALAVLPLLSITQIRGFETFETAIDMISKTPESIDPAVKTEEFSYGPHSLQKILVHQIRSDPPTQQSAATEQYWIV